MEKANKDQEDFWSGEIAQRWISLEDNLRRSFSGVVDALVEAAELSAESQVLDIGCGNGDSTFAAWQSVGCSVLGADISEPMLERSRFNAQKLGAENVSFVLADAQTYPFKTASYDRIISRFGVMFFSDPVAAFQNMAAALKPTGSMHFICWGPQPKNPWFSLPRRIAEKHLGPLEVAPPNSPGPFGFANSDWVLDQIEQAGLKARVDVLDIPLTPGKTIEDVLETASMGTISAAMREKSGTPEDLKAILAEFRTALKGFETPTGIQIPGCFNLFTVRK